MAGKAGEGPSIIVNLMVAPEIEERVIRRRGRTSRAALDEAVDAWLPQLVGELVNLGFVGGKELRRKPRRMSKETWDKVQTAAAQTGLAAPMLLRACLQLESRGVMDREGPRGGAVQ